MYYDEVEQKEYLIAIWKSHHCLMDGVSSIMVTAATSNEYDKSYFVPSRNVSFLEKLMLRTLAPFYALQIGAEALGGSRDKNVITKNKKKMTGNPVVSTSPKYEVKAIKELSKKLGVTINDLVICALSTSMKEYFK